jgi:hypothetical protein
VKPNKVTNSIKSAGLNVYVIVTIDDNIKSRKRCDVSTVIITVHGSYRLGGSIYNLDSRTGVIPLLVFPIRRYYENVTHAVRNPSLRLNPLTPNDL